jgi:hypothetical protein
MKKILLVLFSIVITVSAFSDEKESKQAKNIENTELIYFTGNVKDKLTGESLAGAKVTLEGTNKKVYTDFDGNFVFEEVISGKYNISVDYISYEKNRIENKNIDILNTSIKLELEPIN